MSHCSSIALDPSKGFIYWSTWASDQDKGLIQYAWMDGTNIKTLVDAKERDLQWPSSLTIEFKSQKLYWCDPRMSIIERIGLDGKNREIIIKKIGNEDFSPFSVAYHNEFIFWTDNVMGNISRVHINLTGSRDKFDVFASEKLKVTDIKVFDNSTQTEIGSCTNKQCPGLALSTPNGCSCVCGNGFSLQSNGTMCVPQKETPAVSKCAPGWLNVLLAYCINQFVFNNNK